MTDLLKIAEGYSEKTEDLAEFQIGDTVNVHVKIKEGDKERIQIFNGTVLAKRASHGATNGTFVVRRVVSGHGVERTFPMSSPKIAQIEVTRKGKARRAKLYYLRDRVGKSTKVKERV